MIHEDLLSRSLRLVKLRSRKPLLVRASCLSIAPMLCVLLCPYVAAGTSAASVKLSYKLVSTSPALPFDGPIERSTILDSFDVDGDGAEDFAVSAKTRITNTKDYTKNRFIHSFFVHNRPGKNAFNAIDLGESGMTQRTWAGKFFRSAQNNVVYFVFAGAGELGPTHTIVGERPAIFQISPEGGSLKVTEVHVGKQRGKGSSVDVCDFDGDGTEEIYINNGNSPFAPTRSVNVPRIIRFDGQEFKDLLFVEHLRGLDTAGYHSYIALADVNGDGRCDLLAAFEPWKIAPFGSGKTTGYRDENVNDHFKSYVALNSGHSFDARRFDLRPYFGKENAAGSIAAAKVDGRQLIALDSSRYPGPKSGFHDFALQLFEWRNGEPVEVTKEMVVGKMDSDDASLDLIRFFDIDGDGNKDIYVNSYEHAVEVYLFVNGKFVLQRLKLGLPDREKSVVFLHTPKSRCADLVVVDSAARLRRFACQLK